MGSRVFNVLFISVFSVMLGLGIVVPLLPYYAESLGATGLWIGAIFSGFSLSRAVFMPLIGKLSDSRGRRFFILTGLLIFTILSFIYIYANSVYSLTAVRIVHGIASAMVIPVALAYIADLSPKGREGMYMGTFMASMFFGMGFGPLVGGVIRDMYGMEAVFISMAVLSFISFLICLLFLPESRGKYRQASLKGALKNKVMRAILFFRAMNAFANGVFMVFLPVLGYLISLPSTQTGMLISTSIFTTAILQRRFGRFADNHNKAVLISAGSAIIAFCFLFIPFLKSFESLLLASLIIGIGGALSMPSAMALVTIAGREIGQGTAMGAFNTAMSIGMITAPMIAGGIMDAMGIYHVFLVSGTICFISIPAFLLMMKMK
ncbi:Arabinose efflux permease [Archaeoglobus sulfaticallidus PM70-1]|uniref:Arabinose efflux permease n=1 Tax=Archaeoglobus sulfaticallidus PM70-1 TaxID=387631 RepID=N0BCN1_9EURY|nr:MFS transporter [Archaeoglobus sulfaticallidus]AGK60768.1 Arabinose efflux permease [Archaeoglobus sulfaticallidus PM70-1]